MNEIAKRLKAIKEEKGITNLEFLYLFPQENGEVGFQIISGILGYTLKRLNDEGKLQEFMNEYLDDFIQALGDESIPFNTDVKEFTIPSIDYRNLINVES